MYLLYDAAHAIFSVIFRPLFKFKVIGKENVPASGPVILASNHASNLDPLLIATALPRRVNFVAKEELFGPPLQRFLNTRWKAIPVRREQLDKGVLRVILARLKAGEIIGLFPEGTRGDGEALLPGKAGIGMIVSMAGAPVVPVYIKGSHLAFGKKNKKFKMTPITMVCGRPVEFPKEPGESGHERYQRISDSIMAEIEKLKSSFA